MSSEPQKKFADFPADSAVAEKLASGKLGFDPDVLRDKYAFERDKRVRPEGVEQYQELSGELDVFNDDPFVEPGFSRDPVEKEVDVAIIGGVIDVEGGVDAEDEAGIAVVLAHEKGMQMTWDYVRDEVAACTRDS